MPARVTATSLSHPHLSHPGEDDCGNHLCGCAGRAGHRADPRTDSVASAICAGAGLGRHRVGSYPLSWLPLPS